MTKKTKVIRTIAAVSAARSEERRVGEVFW